MSKASAAAQAKVLESQPRRKRERIRGARSVAASSGQHDGTAAGPAAAAEVAPQSVAPKKIQADGCTKAQSKDALASDDIPLELINEMDEALKSEREGSNKAEPKRVEQLADFVEEDTPGQSSAAWATASADDALELSMNASTPKAMSKAVPTAAPKPVLKAMPRSVPKAKHVPPPPKALAGKEMLRPRGPRMLVPRGKGSHQAGGKGKGSGKESNSTMNNSRWPGAKGGPGAKGDGCRGGWYDESWQTGEWW